MQYLRTYAFSPFPRLRHVFVRIFCCVKHRGNSGYRNDIKLEEQATEMSRRTLRGEPKTSFAENNPAKEQMAPLDPKNHAEEPSRSIIDHASSRTCFSCRAGHKKSPLQESDQR